MHDIGSKIYAKITLTQWQVMSQLYPHWKSQNEVIVIDSSFVKACNNITRYGISFRNIKVPTQNDNPKLSVYEMCIDETGSSSSQCMQWSYVWQVPSGQNVERRDYVNTWKCFAYYCSLITKYQIYFDFVPAALFGILFNTLRPRQKGRHFADDILKCIFLNENVWIPI